MEALMFLCMESWKESKLATVGIFWKKSGLMGEGGLQSQQNQANQAICHIYIKYSGSQDGLNMS